MTTVAHLSDVHLAPLPWANPLRYLNKRAVGLASWHLRRKKVHQRWAIDSLVQDIVAHAPDHVVISGDLINIGLPAEIAAATDWLRKFEAEIAPRERAASTSALSEASLPDPACRSKLITVVPGNHDYYHGSSGKLAGNSWGRWIGSENFPTETIIGDATGDIVLIGLNTGRATLPFVAKGFLDGDQLERLPEILQNHHELGRKRVIMIHHPPLLEFDNRYDPLCSLSRADAARLVDIISIHGCELILHGHNHTLETRYIERGGDNSQQARVPMHGISSASSVASARPAMWSLYDFAHEDGFSVRRRQLSVEQGTWHWAS